MENFPELSFDVNSKGAKECERSSSHAQAHTITHTSHESCSDTAKHKHLLSATDKHSPDLIDTHTAGVTQPIVIRVMQHCHLERAAREDRRARDAREILRLCTVQQQSVGRCVDCKWHMIGFHARFREDKIVLAKQLALG